MARELGPVITAIVVAGRSGSAIAAEISSMKIQEEIDALDVMGFNVVSYLVAPRLIAMVFALPLLTALCDLLGVLGGLACAVLALDIPAQQYIEVAREALKMNDFVTGLVKASVFGATIVVVTDKWMSPAARSADHIVALPIDAGTAWDTVASAIVLVEALIVRVSESDWEATQKRIRDWDGVRFSMPGYDQDTVDGDEDET